jgi:hypothetical protein
VWLEGECCNGKPTRCLLGMHGPLVYPFVRFCVSLIGPTRALVSFMSPDVVARRRALFFWCILYFPTFGLSLIRRSI